MFVAICKLIVHMLFLVLCRSAYQGKIKYIYFLFQVIVVERAALGEEGIL